MPHQINHRRRQFFSSAAATFAAAQLGSTGFAAATLFALVALGAIVLLMLVQFGPPVAFGSKTPEMSLVRADPLRRS